MGACTFTMYYTGKLTPKDAFRKLYDQAQIEYGTDPYNGTISTTSLVKVLELPPRKDLGQFIDELWEANKIGKWETFCIEVKGATLKRFKDAHPELKGKKGIRGYAFVGLAAE